jgi:hypothetical protein
LYALSCHLTNHLLDGSQLTTRSPRRYRYHAFNIDRFTRTKKEGTFNVLSFVRKFVLIPTMAIA